MRPPPAARASSLSSPAPPHGTLMAAEAPRTPTGCAERSHVPWIGSGFDGLDRPPPAHESGRGVAATTHSKGLPVPAAGAAVDATKGRGLLGWLTEGGTWTPQVPGSAGFAGRARHRLHPPQSSRSGPRQFGPSPSRPRSGSLPDATLAQGEARRIPHPTAQVRGRRGVPSEGGSAPRLSRS